VDGREFAQIKEIGVMSLALGVLIPVCRAGKFAKRWIRVDQCRLETCFDSWELVGVWFRRGI